MIPLTIKNIKQLAQENKYDEIPSLLTPSLLNATYITFSGEQSKVGFRRTSLLHDALLAKDKPLVHLILDLDYDVHYYMDASCNTVFDYAVELNDIDILKKVIVKFKPHLNTFFRDQITPFHKICKTGNLEIVLFAIDHGVERNMVFVQDNSEILLYRAYQYPLDYIKHAFDASDNNKDELINIFSTLVNDYGMKFSKKLFKFAIMYKYTPLIKKILQFKPDFINSVKNTLDLTFCYNEPSIIYSVNYTVFHLLCIGEFENKIKTFISDNIKKDNFIKTVTQPDINKKCPFDYLPEDMHARIAGLYIKKPFQRNIVYCFLWRLLMRPTTLYIKRIVESFD